MPVNFTITDVTLTVCNKHNKRHRSIFASNLSNQRILYPLRKKQKVRFRIACTGTPVENTLADLWCLFDFVQPGMLGALNSFSRTYRRPIEAKTHEQQLKVEELRELIRPQILHRK